MLVAEVGWRSGGGTDERGSSPSRSLRKRGLGDWMRKGEEGGRGYTGCLGNRWVIERCQWGRIELRTEGGKEGGEDPKGGTPVAGVVVSAPVALDFAAEQSESQWGDPNTFFLFGFKKIPGVEEAAEEWAIRSATEAEGPCGRDAACLQESKFPFRLQKQLPGACIS